MNEPDPKMVIQTALQAAHNVLEGNRNAQETLQFLLSQRLDENHSYANIAALIGLQAHLADRIGVMAHIARSEIACAATEGAGLMREAGAKVIAMEMAVQKTQKEILTDMGRMRAELSGASTYVAKALGEQVKTIAEYVSIEIADTLDKKIEYEIRRLDHPFGGGERSNRDLWETLKKALTYVATVFATLGLTLLATYTT